MRSLAIAALMLSGCQEYAIYGERPQIGKGDAPLLGTPSRTDTVVQRISPKVDILWVIDNSGSMQNEQDQIALNMDRFLQYFIGSGLDWHIGVITTDADSQDQNGLLRSVLGYRYVEPANLMSETILPYMIQVGISGSGEERGLLALTNLLNNATPNHATVNAGFYRPDAALHVIVISDEDDQSATPEDPSDPTATASEVINQLRSLKADPEIAVTFSSIVGPSPGGCRAPGTDAGSGTQYIAVTNGVGGLFQSICTQDWGPVVDNLGLLAAGLRTEYFLTQIPVPGTLEVLVEARRKRFHGIDISTVDEGTPIAEACEDKGEKNCFYYTYNNARNSIFTEGWTAPAESRIHFTYDLFSEFRPDEDALDTDVGTDTDTDAE